MLLDLPYLPDAACAGEDPSIFTDDPDYLFVMQAKALCYRCPARQACLDYAVAHNEVGVWGGKTQRERSGMRRYRTVTSTVPAAYVDQAKYPA